MVRMLRFKWVFILVALLLSSCGSNTSDKPDTTDPPTIRDDPYKDPGTAPPATIPIEDRTVTTSGSVAPKAGSGDLIEINIAGFSLAQEATERLSGSAQRPVDDLDASDFTVVEDGVVQGITARRIDNNSVAPADIAFILDTTSSMGVALTSVQASIIDFADFLGASGLDVRLGAVTFGDAFDTRAAGGSRGVSLQDLSPPDFDEDERPSFALSADIESFKAFIEGDAPRGGMDEPENIFGSLEFAFDRLAWRAGAQRILIIITDTCSHTANSQLLFGEFSSPWIPGSYEDVLAKLKGRASVHVVAPLRECFTEGTSDVSRLTGVEGTGGVFFAWDRSAFDLSTLPIAETAASGYIVTYRGERDGSEKTVRVVIDDGSEVRGEFSVQATY